MSKKVELLAPAGNLEKAKIALIYGADAVYVGGKIFSLRARASNFSKEDLKELCEFARSLNKKVYVTCNIIPHDEDFKLLDEYLVPKCEKNGKEYGFCTESKKRTCGRHPRLEEVFEGYYNYKDLCES